MQLIFVVETNNKSKTDWIYISLALRKRYSDKRFQLRPIFSNGKSRLIQQQTKINESFKKYAGESLVIVVADYDNDFDHFNQSIKDYCSKNNYELVWMNPDIEYVFWGKSASEKEKVVLSTKFANNPDKYITDDLISKLSVLNSLTSKGESNIFNVIDRIVKLC